MNLDLRFWKGAAACAAFLAFALIASADRRGQLSQQRPASGWVDPSGSNTLYAWWVSSDFAVNLSVNNTNPWIDRVQGRLLRNGNSTTSATNAALGIYTADASGGLTNAPTAQGSNSTYCIIFRPLNLSSGDNTFNTCLSGPYSLGDGTQGSTPGSFAIRRSTRVIYWGTFNISGQAISSPLANDTTYDLISVQTNSTMVVYTNGTQSASITAMPPLTGWPWFWVGHDTDSAANHFDGYIKEVLIWSNSFSSVQLSNVHFYATNQYSFAP